MRVTIEPGGDVVLTPGVPLSELRGGLARVTGLDPDVGLTVAGLELPGDHLAGVPPLVAGATLVAGKEPSAGTGLAAAPTRRGHPRRAWMRVGGRRAVRLGHGAGTSAVERPQRPSRGADRAEPVPPPAVATWLTPLAASVVLALVLRSPVFLTLALVGPVAVLAPWLWARRRGRRAAPPFVADPAALRDEGSVVASDPLDPGGPAPGSGSGPGAGALSGSGPGTEEVVGTWWRCAREGGLAVVGTPSSTSAVVRVMLVAVLALPPPAVRPLLLLPRAEDEAWSWCRWTLDRLDVARTDAGAALLLDDPAPCPRLVVAAEPGPGRTALQRWWVEGRRPQDGVLLRVRARHEVPRWCRWVLVPGARGWTLHGPDGLLREVHVPSGGLRWAEGRSRELAGARSVLRGTAASPAVGAEGLPALVPLADLLPSAPADVVRRWSGPAPLRTPIGSASTGPVEVDLERDGPHALVAGTTGAGKSELLQSLVLGLALSRPPTELALVLVDYKGGASFGACRHLPHVVGQVTDLDAAAAARALAGVRAELRRREQVLASAGVGDLETLRRRDGDAPPRLVVVVDEFRALTEDLPDFVPGLLRVAAQGRSLGVHLVLATQRPAGAVTAELRANLALRLCLRVTDRADSVDVVEVPDAADLPTGAPGRAVLRRGAGEPEHLQTAWAAAPPTAPRTSAARVRRAPAWAELGDDPLRSRTSPRPPVVRPRVVDHSGTLVAAARTAAATLGLSPPRAPWLPPLPHHLTVRELAAVQRPAPDGLPLALVDLPETRSRAALAWDPDAGVLLVAGGPASGRSTTLGTIAAGALARGDHVHAVVRRGTAEASVVGSAGPRHPGLGSVVPADDPRLVRRLLMRVLDEPGRVRRLLLVDDLGTVLRSLDDGSREGGGPLLDRLVRARGSLGLAVTGLPGDLVRLVPHATDVLALGGLTPTDLVALGLGRDLPPEALPGRALHRGLAGDVVRCQVAVAGPPDPPADAGPPRPLEAGHATTRPFRLVALPDAVDLADLERRVTRESAGQGTAPSATPRPGTTPPGRIPLGVGGDEGEPVLLDASTPILVVGPAGTGRSNALDVIARGLARRGWHLDRHAPGGAPVGGTQAAAARLPRAVVVDDLDLLVRADPRADEVLAGWIDARLTGDPTAPLVVAAARTESAAAAFRGALATLRTAATVVALAPAEPGTREVTGLDPTEAVDPRNPRVPGRGCVVHRGRMVPVQIARAERAQREA